MGRPREAEVLTSFDELSNRRRWDEDELGTLNPAPLRWREATGRPANPIATF